MKIRVIVLLTLCFVFAGISTMLAEIIVLKGSDTLNSRSEEKPAVQVEGGEEISKLLAALADEKYAHVRGGIIPLVKEIGNKEPTPFLFEQIYSRTVQKLIRA